MHIKILLKQVRKEKKITLNMLSKKSDVSVTHINDIENHIKEPSLFVMVKIAKALNMPITELYIIIW